MSDVTAGSREREAAAAFRADVEGLRAVAVGLVLLYHAGLPFVPGGFVGVDVFFVISGFLITGLLVREVERTGRISLGRFYARRAKRLLPAAAVVLAATAALTVAFVPRVRWSDIGGDIAASALYLVNWRLAERSVDYLAEDAAASPVQHFWSLAVEEQYYLVWPVLVLLVAWWVRRSGRRLRPALWVGLAVIAIPSLAWSVWLTAREPAAAFFVTTTRLWELAAGAGIALAATATRWLPRRIAIGLGWTGLGLILGSALVFSASSAWPGYGALLPTVGAAAVILAGPAAGRAGPIAVLGTQPFQWIGALSYSLYLWHWPLVAVAAAYWNGLALRWAVIVVALSIVPAWLTYRLVENPLRFSTALSRLPRLALGKGAALSVTGVLVGLGLVALVSSSRAPADVVHADGAAVLIEQHAVERYRPVERSDVMVPEPLHAEDDIPEAYDLGCQVPHGSDDPVRCDFGSEDGDRTVALVGDSKALQWISALDQIGEDNGWRIETFTKSACPFAEADVLVEDRPYLSCETWNERVLDRLLEDPPDIVLTSQRQRVAVDAASADLSEEAMVEGLRSRWSLLEDAGIPVVVLLDNPTPRNTPVYECVAENLDHLGACAFERNDAEAASGGAAQRAAAALVPGVEIVDLNDYVCPGEICPAVIGDVLVYRQGSHLTATYAESLIPHLAASLWPMVERDG